MDSTEAKIERYHFEEIVLILLILASDLSEYDEEELEIFAEAMEGRVEVLFEQEWLSRLNPKYGVKSELIPLFEELKMGIVALYAPRWRLKLRQEEYLQGIKPLAVKLLGELGIEHMEPILYGETHLTVDWT